MQLQNQTKQLWDNIPAELKALRQWVCYRTNQTPNKLKKMMISPNTGNYAKSNDVSDWSDFKSAVSYMNANKLDGLAFALTEGIVFIDLDDVVNKESKEVKSDIAMSILNELSDTYAELSVSGKGIHIFCKGKMPSWSKNRNDLNNVEVYEKERFCCLTGNRWNNKGYLKDLSDELEKVCLDYVGKRPEQIKNKSYSNTTTLEKSDDGLIDRILNSKQSEKFERLYSGDINDYQSHSQADAAFVWLLAFWSRDPYQIDRIFRSSGLYREKWDRKLYNTTYGNDMIDNALRNVKPHRSLEAEL